MKSRSFSQTLLAAALLTAPAFCASPTLIQAQVGAPGSVYPIVINQSGDYQLSADLVVPCGTSDGIDITASHVTLDLNGFSILCSVPNAYTGVNVSGNDVTIENGSISGFGGAKRSAEAPVTGGGISVSLGSTYFLTQVGKVDHVRLTGNGDGIDGGANSQLTVTNCIIDSNSGNGINAAGGVRVVDSDVSYNSQNGILMNAGAVTGSQISHNSANGIFVSFAGASVTNNYIAFNGGNGSGGFGLAAPSASLVGFGLNTFDNTNDVQSNARTVSMKNNVNSFAETF